MYKELTNKEVAYKLSKEGPFEAYFQIPDSDKWTKVYVSGINMCETYPINIGTSTILTCSIKIEPKLRLMTTEECKAWASTEGAIGWQVKHNVGWHSATSYMYHKIEDYTRRTVQWNNGKPIYGEPEKMMIKE